MSETRSQKRKRLHREYLQSAEWRTFRQKVLNQRGEVCERCGNHGTDIHHKTYVRWGKELLRDVEVLCRACHEVHHIPNNADKELEGIKSRYGGKHYLMSSGEMIHAFPYRVLKLAANSLLMDYETMVEHLNRHDVEVCLRVADKLGVSYKLEDRHRKKHNRKHQKRSPREEKQRVADLRRRYEKAKARCKV